MELVNDKREITFFVEECAWEGVKRVTNKVASDVKMVTGKPQNVMTIDGEITDNYIYNVLSHESEATNNTKKYNVIIAATLGRSPLLDDLINKGLFTIECIQNKREVYKIQLLEHPWDGIDEALIICGSDKRGTIYGLFSLSEYIGVSPLYYWGDIKPHKRDELNIDKNIETVSKEPSVKYRGFFINDEWPCFGNWTVSHFNGFTADMYEHVFELLLRLKGNYLWPAMWTSSFPLDGPKSLNEELADIYGVIIGNSHHEPCLRASEEWDKVRGVESLYGNDWNYYTNKEGLTRYWEDALIRSGKYEKLITIGMRGERDTSMLGDDATLKENIDLLKDIITTQKNLIKKHVNEDLSQVPMMLALYKEVEEYFYGNETCEGLKEWDGLENVICMLCEDNFGYMRTLPTNELRKKVENLNGGFGMYYHFDYHGSPVSYEWMPSAPFSKTWEQMSMAYDYGVRDIWIVNVGDLKFNEVLLAYFMTLAYDFEIHGSNAINSWTKYFDQWVDYSFQSASKDIRNKIWKVFIDFVDINAMRRPESLNASIYHPCNYLESDKMLKRADMIMKDNEEVYLNLSDSERDAYYSMIYFPAKASINLLRMHLYAGKNAHYAKQGKTIANIYAEKVTECINEDNRLADEFSLFMNGKWKGMELAKHIGFMTWNDDNCRYPLKIMVEPANKPRMVISRKDSEFIAHKTYGKPMVIIVDDFLYAGNNEVILEIANDGIGEINYKITIDNIDGSIITDNNTLNNHERMTLKNDNNEQSICDWLSITSLEGNVKTQEEVVLFCDRSKLPKKTQKVRLLIKDAETLIVVEVHGKMVDTENLPAMTFMENHGVITIEANHFYARNDINNGCFKELIGYGRSGCGMKVFPSTVDFMINEEKPSLTYQFFIEKSGMYDIDVYITPTNSVVSRRKLSFCLSDSNGNEQVVTVLPIDYMAGNPKDAKWCKGVLNQIRIAKTTAKFNNGIQFITIGALEAGLVLERIVIYRKGCSPKPSYLGPEESFYRKEVDKSTLIL